MDGSKQESPVGRPWATTRRLRVPLLSLAALVCLLLGRLSLWHHDRYEHPPRLQPSRPNTPNHSSHDAANFDWDSLTPSREVEYRPCYDGHLCARLLLPMDWTEDDEDKRWEHTVAIALTKRPTNRPDLEYGGEIYLNPGGCGASGVAFVLNLGAQLSGIIHSNSSGEAGVRYAYDMVGFDPRGVRFSTPRISCFPDLQATNIWQAMNTGYGSVGSSNVSFLQMLARYEAYGEACNPGDGQNDEDLIMSQSSTAYAARDIFEMAQKGAELDERLGRVQPRAGPKPVRYWGFSYGGVLGGTLAALFPDHIERMVLDAGGNYDDYVSGEWMEFLRRTETGLKWFYKACFEGGPKKCAFHDPDGPVAMEKSVLDILARLRKKPLPIASPSLPMPDIFTADDLLEILFSAMYRPYQEWMPLAEVLSALKTGHKTAEKILKLGRYPRLDVSKSTCTTDKCILANTDFFHDANVAIGCQDMFLPDILTPEEIEAWFAKLQAQSPLFAGMFATGSKLPCARWPVKPKWHYTGPFEGKTKHGILFISTAADPVSPPSGAQAMAKQYEGSRALVQDSPGHCSYRIPSVCTLKVLRRYFQTGELPEEGAVCPMDRHPFKDADFGAMAAEDRELYILADELAKMNFPLGSRW